MYNTSPSLIQRAVQHFQRGELVPASQLLQKILDAQPREFDALHLLGMIRAMEGRYDEGIELMRKALGISKNNAQLQFNLARALSDSGRHNEALLHHRKATQLGPQSKEAWLNLGDCLLKQEKYAEALPAFDEAIRLAPQFAQAWSNKGVALHFCDRPSEALVCYENALRFAPNLAEVHLHKGAALEDLGQHVEAMAAYQKALQLSPDHQGVRWSVAVLALKGEKFQASWDDFELRWARPGCAPPKLKSLKPYWDGKQGEGPLLLWGEQGIGDQVLYAGILPELAKLPRRKMLAVDKRLMPLFARSMPGFELLDLDNVSDDLPFAEQLPLGSLPRYFRKTREDFVRESTNYLRADIQRSTELRVKIARPRQCVCGVAWHSQRRHIGPSKSIALEKMLLPLAGLPLHFVDLQYGDTRAEREALQRNHGIEVQHVDEIDNFNDLDGLAALIQACDVVLTTSNSTAHLAGALGKETLLLLSANSLWYWNRTEIRNLWYPCVTQYSQTHHADWQAPLTQVRQHLQKHHAT